MMVSVIIPVYNAQAFISEAVESAVACDKTGEVILIEDGSIDNSLQECGRLTDLYEKVILVRHPNGENRGAGASRNLGVEMARFDIISFLDADDWYDESVFRKAVEELSEDDSLDGIYLSIGSRITDEVSGESWSKINVHPDGITGVVGDVEPNKLFSYLIGMSTDKKVTGYFSIISLLLRRKKVLQHKINFPENLRLHQDTAFMLKAAYYLKLKKASLTDSVAYRRVHSKNRFIQNQRKSFTKSLLFSYMRGWAIENNLSRDVISHFNREKLLAMNKAIVNNEVSMSRLFNDFRSFLISPKLYVKSVFYIIGKRLGYE